MNREIKIPLSEFTGTRTVFKFVDLRRINIQNPLTCCGLLVAATVGLWLFLALPAWLAARGSGLEGLSYSALLCLVPGLLVFLTVPFLVPAEKQLLVSMSVGAPLRLLFVLLGVLLIVSERADLRLREFLIWLVIFYMATLIFETLLLLKRQSSADIGSETISR